MVRTFEEIRMSGETLTIWTAEATMVVGARWDAETRRIVLCIEEEAHAAAVPRSFVALSAGAEVPQGASFVALVDKGTTSVALYEERRK